MQQLLNNPAISDYGEILPLVEDVLSDLRRDAAADPQERLDALVTTYCSLGVDVTVTGTLPADARQAGGFVRIIREAMTNALLHGQARSIAVTFGTGRQPALVIADDGQGCPGPIQTGTGLAGYGAAGTGVRRPSDADQDTALYHYCRNGGEP